jgi:hypothetical protein
MTEHEDLVLLEAVVAATGRRISVPLAEAYERAYGRPLTAAGWVGARRSVLRLEQAGLLHSDVEQRLEPTEEGRAAVQPRNSA